MLKGVNEFWPEADSKALCEDLFPIGPPSRGRRSPVCREPYGKGGYKETRKMDNANVVLDVENCFPSH